MTNQPYAEEEVEDGVWQFTGSHPWGLGVNAIAFVSGKQAIVVDNLYRPDDARQMFRSIERRGVAPSALVNTHFHTDHTIANCLYACPIWAHASSPKLLEEIWPKWVGGPDDPRAGGLTMKVPDHLFERETTLDLDGEEIRLLHLPGHTADSIGVFLPERRIFVGGDTIMALPVIWFGDSLQELRTYREIERLGARTILQGHGGPCSGSRVTEDIRYLERLHEEARTARDAGLTKEQFLDTPWERMLPPERVMTLPSGYAEAHRANLGKVWNETATPA
jgi:cyclase